jgi:hypothetical protein
MNGMPTPEQLADESKRARKGRQLVDIATAFIVRSNLTDRDAEVFVREVRTRILHLFPDGVETYKVIYAQRFKRLISEYAKPSCAVVIRSQPVSPEALQPQLGHFSRPIFKTIGTG